MKKKITVHFKIQDKRILDGCIIKQERRGLWHVQYLNRPGKAWYSGTLRECEKAFGHKSVVVVV